MVEPVNSPTIIESLRLVQIELRAPKGQRNKFGNYDYRSAEDILEAVKPVLADNNLTLVIDDEIVMIGDRYYVKATAAVFNEAGGTIGAHAYAREAEDKKGMDSAQVTGATSSYARKYALNGLFAIDDSKDADTDEHKNTSDKRESTTSNSAPKASQKQIDLLGDLLSAKGFDDKRVKATLDTVRDNAAAASDMISKIKGEEQPKERTWK